MKFEQIAPVAILILSAFSGAGYAVAGDARLAIYWLAAAVLTASVTF